MKRINCNNSESKAVEFILNGGRKDEIMVFAVIDTEYWFTVGTFYKTEAGAKRAAVKAMAKLGYTFDADEMANLDIING